MLWASLYAKAGNAQNAQGIASAMGISTQAAQGIYANWFKTNFSPHTPPTPCVPHQSKHNTQQMPCARNQSVSISKNCSVTPQKTKPT